MNFKALSLKHVLAGLLLLISLNISAQKKEPSRIDSLLKQLPPAKEDTNKAILLIKLGGTYSKLKKTDSAVFYLQRALLLAEKLQWQKGIAGSYYYLGYHYYSQANYAKAQNYLTKATELSFKAGDYQLAFESVRDLANTIYYLKRGSGEISCLVSAAGRFEKNNQLGPLINTYMLIGDFSSHEFNYNAAMDYYGRALKLQETTQHNYLRPYDLLNVGNFYLQLHNTKKARMILLKEIRLAEQMRIEDYITNGYIDLAHCNDAEHDIAGAMINYNKALQVAQKANNYTNLCATENEMSWDYFLKKDYEKALLHAKHATGYVKADSAVLAYAWSTLGSIYRDAPGAVIVEAGLKPGRQYESSLALLLEGLKYGQAHRTFELVNESWRELTLTYEKMNRYTDAFKAYKTYITQRDSTDSLKNVKAVLLKEAQLNYSHKEDSLKYQQNITGAQLKQKKQQSYFFIGGLAALLILSMFIALNYLNQRKANRLLSEQGEEITAQRDQLADTLANLKTAQQQLIQSEKMASLGELTAGIAHEIQNPLNFVNNFSEVNEEMLDELEEEVNAGRINEALLLVADIRENESKIRHHGKRADSIVKGMLEHSRKSTGQKEPIDINKLADEYLRLAYHGLRAKDKTFNAGLITHFEQNLPPVNIMPQDIGRVLLNLFNNAFYATQQKQKMAGSGYKPTVEVATSLSENHMVIKIKDNGAGIPADIKDKILQPFFTTKPTGEGTGLGLSLSYDIVVKSHGGSIKIESLEGEGAEFTIQLPIVS
jgi:two-component system NtrC family sensor kinase